MSINLFKVYLQSINKLNKKKSNILLQEGEDDQEEIDDQGDEEEIDDQGDGQEDQQDIDDQGDDQGDDSDQDDQENTQSDIDLRFSADLASQFGNTVNQFTQVAANVIKKRSVNKDDSDKIFNLMGKIKDLLDAAKKSN